MTFADLAANFEIELDKVQAPYFPDDWKDEIFNTAMKEWLDNNSPDYEKTERRRQDFAPIIKHQEFVGAITQFAATDLLNPLYVITAIGGDFSFECNGTITPRTRPIVPIKHDSIYVNLDDPDNVPNDQYPGYLMEDDLYKIKSTNAPTKLYIDYLMQPPVINIATAPTDVFIFSDAVAYEITSIAVRIAIGNIESPRYQIQSIETDKMQ